MQKIKAFNCSVPVTLENNACNPIDFDLIYLRWNSGVDKFFILSRVFWCEQSCELLFCTTNPGKETKTLRVGWPSVELLILPGSATVCVALHKLLSECSPMTCKPQIHWISVRITFGNIYKALSKAQKYLLSSLWSALLSLSWSIRSLYVKVKLALPPSIYYAVRFSAFWRILWRWV